MSMLQGQVQRIKHGQQHLRDCRHRTARYGAEVALLTHDLVNVLGLRVQLHSRAFQVVVFYNSGLMWLDKLHADHSTVDHISLHEHDAILIQTLPEGFLRKHGERTKAKQACSPVACQALLCYAESSGKDTMLKEGRQNESCTRDISPKWLWKEDSRLRSVENDRSIAIRLRACCVSSCVCKLPSTSKRACQKPISPRGPAHICASIHWARHKGEVHAIVSVSRTT